MVATTVVEDTVNILNELIELKDFTGLRELTRNWRAGDLADVMEPLSAEKEAIVFRLLPREQAAAVFTYLPEERQNQLLRAMGHKQVASMLNAMSPDDRTSLLEELPAEATQQLLNSLSARERTVASQLLGYDEHSVGRLMTPDFVRIRPQWTISRALQHIRQYGVDSETMSMIYVIDARDKLVDDLRLRQLLLASPKARVSELMDNRFVALKATDDRETAVAEFRDTDLSALPVTDTEGVLLGIVTVDDILDVAEKEATEDIQKIGGSEALDEPYMQIAIPKMVRKRATWLVILFLSEMLTATAMGRFESEIAKAVILSIFIPARHFQRRQLRLTGLHTDHPRHGGGRSALARLVEGDAAGDPLRPLTGSNPGRDRLYPHQHVGASISFLRPVLAPSSADGRPGFGRDRPMGQPGRFHVAVPTAAARY